MRDFKNILLEAEQKGAQALYNCTTLPVSWVQSDLCNKPLSKPYYDTEGECGGAYITGLEGNSEFVRWANRSYPGLLNKGVYKGYDLSLSQFTMKIYNGQSAEKYAMFAKAFCQVLNNHGIRCYVKTYLT